MAASFSQQLEDLLNPLPKFAEDPEDGDEDEATRARVAEFNDEGDDDDDGDDDDGEGGSSLRKNNATLLSDTDPRYVGKTVSRKQLMMMEEEEEDDDDEGEEDGDDEDEEAPQGVDFRKLTEGMDDLGVSEEDDDDDDVSGEEDEDEDEDATEEEEEAVHTFSKEKVDEEVAKGRAVKNQLLLWDRLLEGRIKTQKALATANRLPQPHALPEFKRRGGAELAAPLKDARKALKALQRALLELQDELLARSDGTGAVADGEGEEGDARAPKRKLEASAYPGVMAKRFAAFRPYRDATLRKWHDRTRLSAGKSGKGFGAFERDVLTQVEQVLADKERLLRRTRTRRSEYRVLGKKEASPMETVVDAADDDDGDAAAAAAQPQLKANAHLKDLDEDIFDDDDFYHQLLRELIERRTSAADPNDQVAAGRQWLAIQKLRGKIKRKVDTKASKGRRVRFHVHAKLVNFMAPVDRGAMGDEARGELYRGLFGRNAAARE